MATAVGDSGKRRDPREEKRIHGSVKKRRKSSRSPSKEKNQKEASERKVKKKSMKKKQKGRDKEKRKVRSISELAELVKSGQVQLPKSLSHYQDDRLQLLDQVFTILSEDDVKGMLPDILKGLKMKRVKELCLQQLRELSEEQINDAIHGTSVPPPSLNTDSFSDKEKLGSEKGGGGAEGEMEGGGGEDLKQVLCGEGVKGEEGKEAEEEEEGEIVITVSDVSVSSAESDQKGTGDFVTEKAASATFSRGSSLDKECAETSLNIHLSSKSQAQETEKLEDAVEMYNAEDCSTKESVSLKDGRRLFSGTKEEEKELNDASQKRTQADLPKLNTKGSRVDPDSERAESVEEYSPVAVEKHTLAASQFLEMELRRRALEAEMRRTKGTGRSESGSSTRRGSTGSVVNSGGGVAELGDREGAAIPEPKSVHSQSKNQRLGPSGNKVETTETCGSYEQKRDHVIYSQSRDGKEEGEDQASKKASTGHTDMLEVRELLEERLRQRALQAMLRAKKTNSAT